MLPLYPCPCPPSARLPAHQDAWLLSPAEDEVWRGLLESWASRRRLERKLTMDYLMPSQRFIFPLRLYFINNSRVFGRTSLSQDTGRLVGTYFRFYFVNLVYSRVTKLFIPTHQIFWALLSRLSDRSFINPFFFCHSPWNEPWWKSFWEKLVVFHRAQAGQNVFRLMY